MDSVEIRVARIEETLNTVIGKLHDLSGSVAGGFEKIDKNFGVVKNSLSTVDMRLDTIETKLKELRGNSAASLETIEDKITGLTAEILKINEVTQFEGQFDNLKILKKE